MCMTHAEPHQKQRLAFVLWGPRTAGLLVLLFLGLILEVLIASGIAAPSIVAAPSEMLMSLERLFTKDNLGAAFLITLAQALSATLLAMLIGLPLGWTLFRYEVLGRAYRGWLAAMFAAPLVLLYPLFLVIIGRNYGTTITMGVITGSIPVALYTCEALHKVSPTLLKVGAAFNLTARQTFTLIQVPAAVPDAFTGIRLGLIYSLVNIIGIEFLIDFGGLGRVVSTMFFRYDIPGMYAAIFFIILISLLFLTVLKKVERWLRPV